MSAVLLKYVPEQAIPLIAHWLKLYNLHLTISKSRISKLGDFRPAFKGKPNRISVNGDLNAHHFLITLCHEVAHAAVWKEYGRKVLPHGKEWQDSYREILLEMNGKVVFPPKVEAAIKLHLKRPKASSCSDPKLYKLLKEFDADAEEITFLEELEEGSHFIIHNKRSFQKGKKRRSRYECICLESKRLYYVSAHAEVQLIPPN